jgi:hypothetical protein
VVTCHFSSLFASTFSKLFDVMVPRFSEHDTHNANKLLGGLLINQKLSKPDGWEVDHFKESGWLVRSSFAKILDKNVRVDASFWHAWCKREPCLSSHHVA